MGRFAESFQAYQRAFDLDPLSEMINTSIGIVSYWAGQSERAVAQFQKVLELNPHYSVAQSFLAETYVRRGDFAAAAATVAELRQSANDPLTLPTIGYVYGKIGDHQQAQEILNELTQRAANKFVSALNFAQIYAGLGDAEQTLAWLEKACREHPIWITFLKVDLKFDFLRSNSRFQKILRQIGFSPDKQTDESPEAQTAMLSSGVNNRQAENLSPSSAILRRTVGRRQERAELRAAFDAALGGRGSLLCIAGEPGIGKTTLVEDFLAELASGDQCLVARGRCSERLAGTEAYLPLLEALESLMHSDPRFASAAKQNAPTWYAQIAPLTAGSEESARLLNEVKAASQERMKRELASLLTGAAERQPLVIFFDDLHWADVSTIDMLSFLAGKFDAARVLVVATYRPSDMLLARHSFLQIKTDLQARGLCREILLEFLTEADIAEYLALEFPRRSFPPDFARMIHEKTEGSPLFMADLARYLRDRGVIAQSDGGEWILAQTLPDIERELPESVRAMIERKLAQLSEDDRALLSAAAVQGCEFDSAVVARALKLGADEIEERLEKLERVFAFVKLVSEAEFPNRALTLRYRFVHVLYQNALYAALRATRKVALSREIARTIEDFYGDQRTSVTSRLAALFEAAREFELAAEYYRLAAEHATRVFAYQESVALARRGLELLKSTPDTTARAQQELALQVTLSVPLGACRGLASGESRELFTRTRGLARQLGDPPELWTIMVGQWRSYLVGGDNNTALKLAEEFLPLVRAEAPAAVVWGHQMLTSSFNYRGEFSSACAHVKEMLEVRNRQPNDEAAVIYAGEDPVMIGLFMGAASLWYLGFPDQALRQSGEAMKLARQNGSPFGLALAHFLAAELHISRRETRRVREMADDCLALSAEHGFPQWVANGNICRGWSLVGAGEEAAGAEQMREGITVMHAIEADLGRSRYLALLAEACAAAGQTAEGLSLLAEALSFAEQSGERFFEAEIFRLRGELLLKSEAPPAEAEECFHKAVEIARRQRAKSLELRAAMSVARLWRRQGKHAEARQMLAKIYEWFTEGFETADLQEAKELIETLNSIDLPLERNSQTGESFEAQTVTLKPTTAENIQPEEIAEDDLKAQTTDVRQNSKPTVNPKSKIQNPKFKWWLFGLLCVSVLVSGFFAYRYFTPINKQIESIAVMPFVNESGNADVEYLSDGMTETLISSLSNLPNLNVKPRSSVFRYKGKEIDPQTIGKELNVQAILNGRVVQRGQDISLFVELIDISLNKVVWSETYNRKQTDLVALQTDIARDVSGKIKNKLSGEDIAKVTKTYTTNPEAYQLYLKGNFYRTKYTEEGYKKGVEYYEKAIAVDPNYALAYHGIAAAYDFANGWYLTPKEAEPKAKEACLKALELDETLAETHFLLGKILFWYEWDWASAEREWKRANELDSAYPARYPLYLVAAKRFDEAVKTQEAVQQRFPLDLNVNLDLAGILLSAGRYDRSIEQSRKALELDPNFWWSYQILGLAYERKKQYAEAIAALEKARLVENNPSNLGYLGAVYGIAGKTAEAQKALAELKELSKQRYVSSYFIAVIYAGLGDRNQAFEWFEKAFQERSPFMTLLRAETVVDSLRPDPRFQDLLRRLNLPE